MTRLTSLNAHYLRALADGELVTRLAPWLDRPDYRSDDVAMARLEAGMDGLKQRARTLVELGDAAGLYLSRRPLALTRRPRRCSTRRRASGSTPCVRALAGARRWDEAVLEAAAALRQNVRGWASASSPSRCAPPSPGGPSRPGSSS